ncbi:hypothetical protein PCIT_a3999 [Pseudoalteromonas citrea]|uniref:Uncharacterized protein n=2 Tax=Pseudoalteromonas citrea TaxID=43655 RepID=A0AAD4FRY9_9GAMM|nr:hypothetical protein [Pseudoalteromonas citrea]KAF7771425.1 hypothetical protein PCIT_a3999 [Pseudoalteromonas citrea]
MKITIPVAEFNGNAEVVMPEARKVTLSDKSVADIVNHALQLVVAEDNEVDNSLIMNELADALDAYGIYNN